jgi:hypothetical protein
VCDLATRSDLGGRHASLGTVSDEADNVVLRHLREFRAELKTDFASLRTDLDERLVKMELQLADLRGLVLSTRADLGRQVEELRAELKSGLRDIRVTDRLAALESQVAELQRQRGS